MDFGGGPSHIVGMPRLLLACCGLLVTALSLEGQSVSRLGTNARLRLWSESYALRAAEARLIDRWADTLVVAIERPDALEPVRETLTLSTAQLQTLEFWSSTAREPRAVRNRFLVLGGIGVAVIAGAAGGIFSVGEAMFSAALVTMFVAAGSTDAPLGAWVRIDLTTAPAPAAPGPR